MLKAIKLHIRRIFIQVASVLLHFTRGFGGATCTHELVSFESRSKVLF